MPEIAEPPDLLSFGTFHDACHGVLSYLHRTLGFDLWMVTRTEGDDWIVLEAEDHGYGVATGNVFRWTDSFCSRMVAGQGPRIAPCSKTIPAYVEAPIGQQVPIGAYVGIPLTWHDGELFGTLCAIHPTPRPDSIAEHQPLLELLGRLLSSLLEAELATSETKRQAERASLDAMTDPLTGLYNRRAWDELLVIEETRCHRYGHPACLLSIGMDHLKSLNHAQGHARGDASIRAAAAAIEASLRNSDVAARVGDDEFGVLAAECDDEAASHLVQRLQRAFEARGLSASIGRVACQPHQPFAESWKLADQAMYASKDGRKYAAATLSANTAALPQPQV